MLLNAVGKTVSDEQAVKFASSTRSAIAAKHRSFLPKLALRSIGDMELLHRESSRSRWAEMNSDTDLDDGERAAALEPLFLSTQSDPKLLFALPGLFRKNDFELPLMEPCRVHDSLDENYDCEDCDLELPKCGGPLRNKIR